MVEFLQIYNFYVPFNYITLACKLMFYLCQICDKETKTIMFLQ